MHPLAEHIHAWFADTPLPPDSCVLVGVSGGPDSLCLLHVLRTIQTELGLTLHVAHLDHQLRGAESAADADFVAATAQAWGIPATITAIDVQAYARTHRLNLHDAARIVRYRWLADVALALGAQAVAVAHTADDQAETLLMHLLRGAGSAGLRGMRPLVAWDEWAGVRGQRTYLPSSVRSSSVGPALIRPLLTTTRAEVEAYCQEHALQPRRDPTNVDLQHTRNRIRHELLPLLKTYNPQIIAALGRTAQIAVDEHTFLQQALDAAWPGLVHVDLNSVAFDSAAWHALHPALQRLALRRAHTQLASNATLSWERLEQARQAVGQPGRRIELPGRVQLVTKSYSGFALVRAGHQRALIGPQLAADELALPTAGTLELGHGWHIIVEPRAPAAPGSPWQIALGTDLLPAPLVLRRRRAGDRIALSAGRGHRRLQDAFVDAKIAQPLRAAWPILVSGEVVVWVPGVRADPAYVATPGSHQVLWIQCCGPDVPEPRTIASTDALEPT